MKRSALFALTVLLLMGLIPTVWAGGTSEAAPGGTVELVIPHYKAGQNVGARFFLPQVERFNTEYSGTYHIVIQEAPQDGYLDKIQQLAQQHQLPALIEGANPQWFEDVIIANDRVYDLGPWLTETGIRDIIIPDALEYNTRNGRIVSLPNAVARPIELYYNETMFQPSKNVGDMTLEEFLTELGDDKIAFMTSENAWTTALFFTSLIVSQPGGAQMLRNGVLDKVYDYTGSIWLNATTELQDLLQNHATANTLGAAYADAANAFMSRNAAVIANGPWMVNDFVSDASDKWSNGFDGSHVRGVAYPGNSAIDNVMAYRWWIPAETPQPQIDAALAFLEFMMRPSELEAYMLAEGGVAPYLDVSDGYREELAKNPILSDLANSVNPDTTITVNALDVMPASVANSEFGKLLPKLLDGSFTPAAFLEELSKKAEETRM